MNRRTLLLAVFGGAFVLATVAGIVYLFLVSGASGLSGCAVALGLEDEPEEVPVAAEPGAEGGRRDAE